MRMVLCLSPQSNFSNSSFSKNLNYLVSSIHCLTSNTYCFYNLSVGTDSDQERVEAIGFCNRVLFRVDCLKCIAQATKNLTTNCIFRYSNKPIFKKPKTFPVLEALNPEQRHRR
ncbi:hypothetical protein ARALYDRAFT_899807 [Arabidopsis lyrata subsp. lyrata]|uniref:Gnk2-homologous domain-containing protein n=1 Tax=Arabidopsis lyrata subsp. lyrata TaxID=81972 RepID=D7L4G6_ARALL|nr:hypothetical protein ARALYDRAFT_899807 [Arabidopsis lyrata subsp. lyrata]